MGIFAILELAIKHPEELRAMVTYKVWRDPLNDIKSNPEESGWSRETMRDCWTLLDQTSRSFAAVIKELKGQLSRFICIFYLVLRALDTIEDDMTIEPERKIQLLVNFYKKLEEPGWNFTESGPNEKDRHLLVDFHKVIEEYQLLEQKYKTVISDITAKMGAGMASYIEASAKSTFTMSKWEDYDLYCHFVAGLVGEGVSRIFSESSMERSWLGEQLTLSNHMGLFLQKTNIIRDYAEDCAEGRHFWPKECWAAPGADFSSQADVAKGIVEISKGSRHYRADGPEGQKAMLVLSTMLLDALRHSTKALDYLSLIREQSIFNFCAIPQIMAIATINAMMNNPDVFKRNVKIRKSQAVHLILKAVNPRDVSYVFLDYSAQMRQKLKPSDPNFIQWSIQLGKIEQWCETYYPSFVTAATEGREADRRSAAMDKYSKERLQMAEARALATGAVQPTAVNAGFDARRGNMTPAEREAADKKDQKDMIRFFTYMMIIMSMVMMLVALGGFEIAVSAPSPRDTWSGLTKVPASSTHQWYLTQEEQDPFSIWVMKTYHGSREMLWQAVASGSGSVKSAAQGVREKLEL